MLNTDSSTRQARHARRACSGSQREKYEALLAKEAEVTRYLGRLPQLQHELTTQRAGVDAELRETRLRVAQYRKVAEGAAPTSAMLADVRTTLQYRQMQAQDAEEAAVRAGDLELTAGDMALVPLVCGAMMRRRLVWSGGGASRQDVVCSWQLRVLVILRRHLIAWCQCSVSIALAVMLAGHTIGGLYWRVSDSAARWAHAEEA